VLNEDRKKYNEEEETFSGGIYTTYWNNNIKSCDDILTMIDNVVEKSIQEKKRNIVKLTTSFGLIIESIDKSKLDSIQTKPYTDELFNTSSNSSSSSSSSSS
jgi:hypothetical protein